MTLYERFRGLDIDFSQLELEPGDTTAGYFCTPVGAQVIGWAGVDGIHFCFVEGFGEMVFTVSPMNTRGNYVKPVANTFGDFLRLVLACGGTAAIEQAWMWNRGEFDGFLETYPPDAEQRAALDGLRAGLGLTPMDDPYGYIKEVQSSFDYGKIPFPEEYYELGADEPEPQEVPERPEWRVTFEGGFFPRGGRERPGTEIPVSKTFSWGGRTWHVPAVYACGKGLVVDFCVEVDLWAYHNFVEKWRPWWEGDRPLTPEDEERQEAENPLRIDFTAKATVNGKELRPRSGCGSCWIPMSCRPEGEQTQQDWEEVWLMEHYGLDAEKGWMFWRQSFPWATLTKPKVKTLSLSLGQEPASVPGPRFTVSGVGDAVPFIHPVTGEGHTLTVVEYEEQEMDLSRLPDAGDWEYPTHCTAMSYVIEPELPRESLTVQDCGRGDSTRPKVHTNGGPTAAGSVCIIGGADGPTAILLTNGKTGHPRAAISALRFERPEQIAWRMTFRQKTVEDVTVALLPRPDGKGGGPDE